MAIKKKKTKASYVEDDIIAINNNNYKLSDEAKSCILSVAKDLYLDNKDIPLSELITRITVLWIAM